MKQSVRDMQDTVKQSNVYVVRISEGEKKENKAEALFEDLIVGNQPIGLRISENPNQVNTKKITCRHMIIKLQKTKDKDKISKLPG